jgi:arylsulfatase A-like enzyme
MYGIFMAYGKAIRGGVEVSGAGLVDLAPTILHMLGEPIPAHMDGRVLTEIIADTFEPQETGHREVTWSVEPKPQGDVLSEEEEQLLGERLRNLGYVG